MADTGNSKGFTLVELLVVIAIISAVFVPEEQKPPLSEWNVVLLTPAGESVEEWTIQCHGYPYKINEWGGQTTLMDKHTNTYEDFEWEYHIQAPTGWAFKITEIKEK